MLGFHLYRQAGMIRDFKLDEQKLCNWLQRIESGYDANNPYHNRCAISAPCPPKTPPLLLDRRSLPTCHGLVSTADMALTYSMSPGQWLQCLQFVTDCKANYKLSTEHQIPFVSTTMRMMLAPCGSLQGLSLLTNA